VVKCPSARSPFELLYTIIATDSTTMKWLLLASLQGLLLHRSVSAFLSPVGGKMGAVRSSSQQQATTHPLNAVRRGDVRSVWTMMPDEPAPEVSKHGAV